MSNISETIIKLIDSGRPVLDIAKLFGGLEKLLEITKKYPYLQAIINTKLGGDLHCSAENEDGDMIPFSLSSNTCNKKGKATFTSSLFKYSNSPLIDESDSVDGFTNLR